MKEKNKEGGGGGGGGGEKTESSTLHTYSCSICCAEADGGRATQHWDSSHLIHQLHTDLLRSTIFWDGECRLRLACWRDNPHNEV